MIRRIGKDIRVRWRILTNGEASPLEGRDLRLEVVTRFGRTERAFSVEDGNVVVFTLPGMEQRYLGEYTFTLWENWGKAGQTAVDSCGGIELVPTTCMEVGDSGLETETVELETSVLELGVSGDSAYEIWLSQGHEGTEEDFLAWLRQPAEDAGKEAQEAATRADSAAKTANNTNSLVGAAEQQRKVAELGRVSAEQRRVRAEQERAAEFNTLKEESGEATDAANAAAASAEQAAKDANAAAEGIDNKLSGKQDKTDQSLKTSDKTVTGAINEVYVSLGDIDAILDEINGEDAI